MIVGLNSCVYETEQHHYGFIGGNQLRHLERLMDKGVVEPAGLLVAVLHHHLHPFPEPLQTQREGAEVWMDMSTVRDAGLVEKRLERLGFDLVLHGHKHKPQLRETVVKDRGYTDNQPGRLIVCGAGSIGVNSSELEHNIANHYEVIELLRMPRQTGVDFVRIEWRELAVNPEAEWVTPASWVLGG